MPLQHCDYHFWVKKLVTQSCLTLCDPMDCSPPGSSVEFSRQEYWSGLPFPSPGDFWVGGGKFKLRKLFLEVSLKGINKDPGYVRGSAENLQHF